MYDAKSNMWTINWISIPDQSLASRVPVDTMLLLSEREQQGKSMFRGFGIGGGVGVGR